MKKRVLFYFVVIFTTLSMQSCVSNYVVSTPTNFVSEYKTNAKLASIENKKLETAKKHLLDTFASEKVSTANSLNASLKNEEISQASRYSKKIDDILTEAESYIGTPYRYGGMTRSGIDCSAFVLSVFGAAIGKTLPRIAAAQAQEGDRIDKENLQRGDLVFFSHGRGRISHVGIVEDITESGEVKFIHAATSKGVMISSLNDSYWGPRYRFAKRVINNDNNLVVN